MPQDLEFDVHFWIKPETRNMVALVTISRGKRAIAIDMPIEQAMEQLRTFIEEEIEDNA